MFTTLEELTIFLKVRIEKMKLNQLTYFNGNRIIITIDKNEVRTKIVVPIIREKKPPRLAPEFIRRIQEVKKVLKGKRDAIYLFTLIMSLHSELIKAKISQMDNQSKEVIIPAMNMIEQDLIKLVVQKEVK